MEVKIYEFDGGEKECIAAENLQQAKEYYKKEFMMAGESFKDWGIREVNIKKEDMWYDIDIDFDSPIRDLESCEEYTIMDGMLFQKMTYEEVLEKDKDKEKIPFLISTTCI